MVGFIQGAVNDGAEILCGGKIPKFDSKLDKGYFLEPTILGGQYYLNVVEGGVRKVRKPQNRTEIRQKPQNASVFFFTNTETARTRRSQCESGRQQDL